MHRLLLPVQRTAPVGPLAGLLCLQERLNPSVARLSGWPKVDTYLQAERAHLLLLGARQTPGPLGHEQESSPRDITLLFKRCPDQGERGVPRLDIMQVRGRAINAGSLIRLLHAVIETAFPHAVLSRWTAL